MRLSEFSLCCVIKFLISLVIRFSFEKLLSPVQFVKGRIILNAIVILGNDVINKFHELGYTNEEYCNNLY